jgi:8-oxo-dGTP diphosphatase
MQIDNPLYKNQGIHVISSIFTVEKGITKVLLIKRKNEPYKDMWALPGGALYNNEEIKRGALREIYEKTGIKDIDLLLCNVYGDVDRSPVMRMIAVSYIGVIDSIRVSVLHETLKTSNADWFPIDKIPKLAYDHNIIIKDALEKLKEEIIDTDILKSLFPKEFTLPELLNSYESILGEKFDRRNFRRKLLSMNLIKDTKKEIIYKGTKPAKLYKF